MNATATPEPDLFVVHTHAQPPQPQALQLQFTGVLRSDAQVRVKPVGTDGHVLPVLCLDLSHVGDAHHTVHAEQVFSEATRAQADAKAKALKKGTVVHINHSLLDMRIFLPHVESIAIVPSA